MPNKVIENGRVPRVKGVDKRIRLTSEQRAEIRNNIEGLSNYQLAAKYGVSKRLIQFIRRPEAHRENLLRRQERGGTMKYYDRAKHAESVAAHREHKRGLLRNGLLLSACPGIEIEPGVFSGCTGTGGDCPTCGC